jgi:hypothetical protein
VPTMVDISAAVSMAQTVGADAFGAAAAAVGGFAAAEGVRAPEAAPASCFEHPGDRAVRDAKASSRRTLFVSISPA